MLRKFKNYLKQSLSKNDKLYGFAKNSYHFVRRLKLRFVASNSITFSNETQIRFNFASKEHSGNIVVLEGNFSVENQEKLREFLSRKPLQNNEERVLVDGGSFLVAPYFRGRIDKKIKIYPDYRKSNPFQDGLYIGMKDISYIQTASGLLNLLIDKESILEIHIHWTSELLKHATVKIWIEALSSFVDRGGVFLWFIHNFYPHDTGGDSEEKRLRIYLAASARKIIILSPTNQSELINEFNISVDKLLMLPHGNYDPFVKNWRVSKPAVEKEFKLLIFGKIKRYKGVLEFIQMFIQRSRKLENWGLVIAGEVVDEDLARKIKKYESRDDISLILKNLEHEELLGLIRDCNMVVQNYSSGLNSGVTIMALTMGKPIVALDKEIFYFHIENLGNGGFYKDQKSLEAVLESYSKNQKSWEYFARFSMVKFNWSAISYNRDLIWQTKKDQTENFTYNSSVWGEINYDFSENVENYKKLAIVILNYNSLSRVIKLYYSLLQSNYTDFTIYIVDNNSKGDDALVIKNSLKCNLIRVFKNCGYAVGNNIAIDFIAKSKKHERILVINPDCEVKSDFLYKMISNYSEDEVLSCLIGNGYSNDDIWFKGGEVHLNSPYSVVKYEGDQAKYKFESDFLSGACLMFHTKLICKIGLFPEEYFLYFEETDWCQVALSRGVRLSVINEVLLYHLKDSEDGEIPKGHFIYYYIRNRYLFFKKWSPNFKEEKILANFEVSWKNRIKALDNPSLLKEYDSLVDRAKQDAKKAVIKDISYDSFDAYNKAAGL